MKKRYLVTEKQNQKLINQLIENSNYPAGAEYDSNAPWNQTDQKYSDVERRDISGLKLIYMYKEEMALVRTQDGSIYVVDIDRAKDDGLWDYVEIPYDEVDDFYDKSQAEIQAEDILSYFVDVMKKGNVGEGLAFWENGSNTVAKVDEELMAELQDIFEFELTDLK